MKVSDDVVFVVKCMSKDYLSYMISSLMKMYVCFGRNENKVIYNNNENFALNASRNRFILCSRKLHTAQQFSK